MLIVREAGGVVVNLNGDNLSLNDTKLIVGNRKIVDDLRGLVLKAGE
jgi:fructose-1,6-bisphosphatase/inositol monophosphatase family enzyme